MVARGQAPRKAKRLEDAVKFIALGFLNVIFRGGGGGPSFWRLFNLVFFFGFLFGQIAFVGSLMFLGHHTDDQGLAEHLLDAAYNNDMPGLAQTFLFLNLASLKGLVGIMCFSCRF